jgi:hypothetical protein
VDWSNVTTLVAVGLGFGLSELATHLRGRWERRRRLYELRIDTYAEWMSGMESVVQSWTAKAPPRGGELGVLRKKLELLEPDARIRRLVREVEETLPAHGSMDFHVMQVAEQVDDFDWKPFREKMNELTERIRLTRPD